MIIAITNIIIINKKKLCESYSTIDFKVEFDDDTEKNIKNDIMEYIENNRSYEIQKKTSSVNEISKEQYLEKYWKNVNKLTHGEENTINNLVEQIKLTIKNQLSSSNYKKWDQMTKNIDWNVIKLTNEGNIIEFNYPFTLGNYIYLRPHNFRVHDKFIELSNMETLFHEYIHLIQRNNQNHFNQRYIKNLNYIKLESYTFKNDYNKYVITNPDSPDNGWLVYFENPEILFMPVLMLNKNNHGSNEKAVIFTPEEYPNLFKNVRRGDKIITENIIVDSNESTDLSTIKPYTNMLKLDYGIYNPHEYLAKILETSLNEDGETFNKIINLYF